MSEEEIGDMMDILELIEENEEKDKEIERLETIIKAAIVYIETEYESLTDNTRILAILNGDENDSLFKKFKGGE